MSEPAAALLLDRSEEERRRIARELHDDIGQRLALLADESDQLLRSLTTENSAILKRVERIVQHTRRLSEDLRSISHVLHPAILEDLGLAAALRSFVEEFHQRTGIDVHFSESATPPNLPMNLCTAVYRITQEALHNVSKHAGQTSAQVELHTMPSGLNLVITDKGAGFDSSEQSGLGLISMRERARLAAGTFKISSAPGKGTTIQVSFPLPQQ